jgi:hypothetical protein
MAEVIYCCLPPIITHHLLFMASPSVGSILAILPRHLAAHDYSRGVARGLEYVEMTAPGKRVTIGFRIP